ncbi:elongation factor G-like protein EF-G2 [Propionicicella superfundia]|uniref:elongation factor G-like protein EF-G2 n=1 Tax=Propionicicella superfundia TaxID=348582 RepID=UPI00041B146E|nr:elongation factor G-like protein EF-G2 [Propionicicella superfundia]
MSSKVNESTQVTSADQLRNVVLVGAAGSGKTTLLEQLLKSRVPGYRGEKESPERAAALFLTSFTAGPAWVNVLDAPGHPDFVGELRAGMRAADAAVFVVSAADGVDAATASLWQEATEANLPRAIALTKLDAGRTDFITALDNCQQVFGAGVQASHYPYVDDDGRILQVLSLVSTNLHDYAGGSRVDGPSGAEHAEVLDELRPPLIEGIIQESEDDAMMDRYLAGDEIDGASLYADMCRAVASANLYPVVPVQAHNGVGIDELISLIEKGFPTPSLHPNPDLLNPQGESLGPAPAAPDAPLVAQVIRTTTDPFAGRLSMVRVFSGTLHADSTVRLSNMTTAAEERIGQLSIAVGTELKSRTSAIAGEIVMLPKLSKAETGDTLSAIDNYVTVEPWTLPEPLLPIAIKAVTRNDEDKLPAALQRLSLEDSAVRVDRSSGEQIVLWTAGQAHADLLLNRLTQRYGVSVEQEPLRIPLRETMIAKATAKGRHVKQSGGHGQYAVCDIEVEPLERGAGFEFVDKVVGGAVPRQFIPSVEKGVRTQLEKGVIAGYPMVDVRVTLFDGKAHSVDSSDMAFQLAGSLAMKEAAVPGKTAALLEPLDLVTVTVGEEYMGAVMTDLSNRRGQLLGTDSNTSHQAIITALVPQAELTRYAIDLRGLARGTGKFTREFHGYELLPSNLAEAYLKQ